MFHFEFCARTNLTYIILIICAVSFCFNRFLTTYSVRYNIDERIKGGGFVVFDVL